MPAENQQQWRCKKPASWGCSPRWWEDVADTSGNQRHRPLDFSVETSLQMPSQSLSDLPFILFAIGWRWINLTKANDQCNVQDHWCFLPVSAKAGRWRDVAHYLASFSVSPYHDCYKPNVGTSKAGHSLSITQSQHHKSLRVSSVRHMTEMTAWKPLGQGSGAVFDPLGLSEVRAKWAFGSAFGSSFFGPFWLCWKEVHQIPSPQLRLCMEGLNNNSMLELWHHKISRTCRIHKPLTRVLFPTWARKKVMARSYKRLSRELGSEFLLN